MKTTVPTLVKLALSASARGRKAGSQYRAAGILLFCGAGNALVSALSATGVVCLAPVTGAELVARKLCAAGSRLRSAVTAATAAAATAAAVSHATPVDAVVSQPDYAGKTETSTVTSPVSGIADTQQNAPVSTDGEQPANP